jgi:predicted small integral membrane protein
VQKSYKLTALILTFCVGFWAFSVTIHDWLDNNTNLEFMRYVLAGSSKAPSSLHITDPIITLVLFYLTLLFESVTVIFLAVACICMTKNLKDDIVFKHSKSIAVYGILLCFIKYFVLFLCISSEWFYMWQTSEMSQVKAGIFSGLLMAILIFLKITDLDMKPEVK